MELTDGAAVFGRFPWDPEVRLHTTYVSCDGITVDGRNPAPKKPWKEDSRHKYQQAMVSHGFKVVRTDLVHPQ